MCRMSFGMPSLPTSCSSARVADALDRVGGQPEQQRHAGREPDHLVGVPGGVVVARLDRGGERLHGRGRGVGLLRGARAPPRRRGWRPRRGPCRCAWPAAARGRRRRAARRASSAAPSRRRRSSSGRRAASPPGRTRAARTRSRTRSATTRASCSVGAGQHEHELVAAVAGGLVVRAHLGAQRVRHAAQQRVAGRVAELVVDPLEVVEVDQDAAERPAVARRRGRSPRARGPASRRG